jgi:8-oxo-dGTP diphosphatase
MRERVAAVIERDQRVLMVRQRAKGAHGRHDGNEYLTLPGGGIDVGETPEEAVAREVWEEVRLTVTRALRLQRVEHRGGATTLFRVVVEDGPAELGTDPELPCDCPRLVGLTWMDAPAEGAWSGVDVGRHLKVRIT